MTDDDVLRWYADQKLSPAAVARLRAAGQDQGPAGLGPDQGPAGLGQDHGPAGLGPDHGPTGLGPDQGPARPGEDRAAHHRGTPPRDPGPQRSRVRWALAAALVVGFWLGAWAWWHHQQAPLTPTPLAYVDPQPIPPEPPKPARIEAPPGLARTEVQIPDGTLSEFLQPGSYVDVWVTVQGRDRPRPDGRRMPETRSLLQAALVLEVLPPGPNGRRPAQEARARRARAVVALLTTPDQHRQVQEAARQGEIGLTLRNDLDGVRTPDSGVDIDDLRRKIEVSKRQVRSASVVAPSVAPSVVWPEPGAVAVTPGAGLVHRAARDPDSTFAMDVDTASYGLSRAELDLGRLPPPARVRVEEFVNALSYDYPAPEEGLFSASVESAPSPWTEGYDIVRIGLRARDRGAREPLHLTFLIDASCSMVDQIGLVQRSLDILVDSLEATDTVAIVRFSDTPNIVLAPTRARDPAVRSAIAGLRADGSTGLQLGLMTAYGLASTRLREPGVHRVVLCTDGMPNVGETHAEGLSTMLRPWTEQGIGLTALGFGRGEYRDELMEAFADRTDGNYAYVDSVDDAREVLAEKVVETLVTVARDAKVQVTWDPEMVVGWRLVGYDDRALADRQFRDDAVDAGEVGAGHQVTALYEVRRTRRAGPLGTLHVRAEPPGPEGQAAVEQSFPISGERHLALDQASADTRIAVAAASLALHLARSPISQLDLGRIFALGQGARRPAHAVDDARLLAMIRAASTAKTPPPPQPRDCWEMKIISGGKTRVILVDRNGVPCR